MNLKEMLQKKLSKKELEELNRSYDIIGEVAVIEISDSLKKKEKIIANAIIKTHPFIKTVLKKRSARSGDYRLYKFQKIFGKSTETIHKENGCRFKLDVSKVYFSTREATERMRIAQQVKPNERVLVMFAGIGAYALVITKVQPKVKRVYGIEINPNAVKFFEENVKLNMQKYISIPVLGDVKKKTKELYNQCDRVVMPLPGEAHKFLRYAIKCVKQNGTIHFYSISTENDKDPFRKSIETIDKECVKQSCKAIIKRKTKVLPYSPRSWKICVDFTVKKPK